MNVFNSKVVVVALSATAGVTAFLTQRLGGLSGVNLFHFRKMSGNKVGLYMGLTLCGQEQTSSCPRLPNERSVEDWKKYAEEYCEKEKVCFMRNTRNELSLVPAHVAGHDQTLPCVATFEELIDRAHSENAGRVSFEQAANSLAFFANARLTKLPHILEPNQQIPSMDEAVKYAARSS